MLLCDTLSAPLTTASINPAPRRLAPRRDRFARPAFLIVADESEICEVLSREVRQQGYNVWIARDSRQALHIFETHAAYIAGVLVDVRLRNVDGPETLRRMLEIRPKVLACFMSGKVGAALVSSSERQGAAHVYWKPFRLTDVVGVIRRMVTAAAPQGCPI